MQSEPIYLIREEECSATMHALVSGSFDPVTVGHMDVIRRAALKFQKVTASVFVNPDKEYLLSIDEKRELLKEACRKLTNVHVTSDTGMLYAFCLTHGIDVIVRGVRDAKDCETEHLAAAFNYEHCGVRTLLLEANPSLRQISSSFLKERLLAGESVGELLPEGVEEPFLNMLLQRL